MLVVCRRRRWRRRASGRAAARAARPRAGRPGALMCTSVACGLITGVQWAVLSQTGPGRRGRSCWGCRRSWRGRRWRGCSPSCASSTADGAGARRSRRGRGVPAMTGRSDAAADPCRRATRAAVGRRRRRGGSAAPGKEVVRRAVGDAGRRPAGGGLARAPGRRRIVVDAVVVVGRAATHERTRDAARWLVRNTVLYVATGVWVLARRWWEARTQRPLRAADARGRGGRGLRAAHRLGAARRAGPGTAAPPPDGLDHRTAGPGPRRSRWRSCAGSGSCSGWARCWPSPTGTPRGCSPRHRRPWTASRGWCGCSA